MKILKLLLCQSTPEGAGEALRGGGGSDWWFRVLTAQHSLAPKPESPYYRGLNNYLYYFGGSLL